MSSIRPCSPPSLPSIHPFIHSFIHSFVRHLVCSFVHSFTKGCTGHALDFDAYTSGSAAWSNLLQDNDGAAGGYGQGIFVEETASGNFIFNNTLRRNRNGIQLYSLDVGPVSGNIVAGNVVEDSSAHGISSGGGSGANGPQHAEKNVVVGNVARNNAAGDYWVNHGSVVGDFWVSNDAESDIPWAGEDPQSSASVSVFEP